MKKIDIVKAESEHDYEICDSMLKSLIKYESKLDSSIDENSTVSGFHERFMKKHDAFLCYAKSDKPIGYIFGYLTNPKGEGVNTNRVIIKNLYIDEEYRNFGIGKKLVESFANWAKEKYLDDYEIELNCIANNDKALSFYEKLGFKTVRLTLRKTKN